MNSLSLFFPFQNDFDMGTVPYHRKRLGTSLFNEYNIIFPGKSCFLKRVILVEINELTTKELIEVYKHRVKYLQTIQEVSGLCFRNTNKVRSFNFKPL